MTNSPRSRAALRWAVEQAALTGARVEAVGVWEPPLPVVAGSALPADPTALTPGIPPVPTGTDAARQAAAEREVDDAVAEVEGSGVPIDRRVASGDPAEILLAASDGADLLVLGNPGLGAISAVVSGSVAFSCAHHARCPVVLVPVRDPV